MAASPGSGRGEGQSACRAEGGGHRRNVVRGSISKLPSRCAPSSTFRCFWGAPQTNRRRQTTFVSSNPALTTKARLQGEGACKAATGRAADNPRKRHAHMTRFPLFRRWRRRVSSDAHEHVRECARARKHGRSPAALASLLWFSGRVSVDARSVIEAAPKCSEVWEGPAQARACGPTVAALRGGVCVAADAHQGFCFAAR